MLWYGEANGLIMMSGWSNLHTLIVETNRIAIRHRQLADDLEISCNLAEKGFRVRINGVPPSRRGSRNFASLGGTHSRIRFSVVRLPQERYAIHGIWACSR